MMEVMNLSTIQAQIDACKYCIEIGGPTPDGYEYIGALGLRLPNHIIITNVANPIVLNPHGDNPHPYSVDEIADITNLPYAPSSIDMFLVSSFPRSLRRTLIHNTAKALRPGGLLIFENVLPDDDAYATQNGFIPLLDSRVLSEHYTQIYQRN